MRKKLSDIFDTDINLYITGIKTNSMEIEPGDLFLCTRGVNVDRHLYIDDAIKKGAVAAVISKDVGSKSIPLIKVKDVNEIMVNVYQEFYDHPEKKIKIITVGGTDGKTTTATMIAHLLGEDKCAYIGTNGYACKAFEGKTLNTTPDADKLYELFRRFLDAGCQYVVLETSSEAFYRNRLKNLQFDVAVFTNITSDHMNVHKSFENYLACKLMQFEQVKKDALAVLNSDDHQFQLFKNKTKAMVKTYGQKTNDDLWIKDYKNNKSFLDITYVYQNQDYQVQLPLVGDYNVYNLAAAILTCSHFVEFKELIAKVKDIKVKGRSEIFHKNGIDFILDYAHTVNGVKSLLQTIKKLDYKNIITVIGQAGGRDRTKRKEMGKIVSENSDITIFTAEDPRDEEVSDIIKDMAFLLSNEDYIAEVNRQKAIRKAYSMAQKGDVILVLGKGREKSHIVKGKEIFFSDYDEIMEIINA